MLGRLLAALSYFGLTGALESMLSRTAGSSGLVIERRRLATAQRDASLYRGRSFAALAGLRQFTLGLSGA